MKKMTIEEIEKQLMGTIEPKEEYIKALKEDGRKGVKRALDKWLKQQEKRQFLHKKFFEMTSFERKLRSLGYQAIAGIDEAGRGPLAGPVVAAAVILPDTFYLPGIDDSKKLTEQKREEYYKLIQTEAIAFGVGIVEAPEIDRINILEASKKAMTDAIRQLSVQPDYLLIDAVRLKTSYPFEALIKGDARSMTIAAASIIAKVTRDRLMKELSNSHPEYGFASNMGYGTGEHLKALKLYGVTPYHRKSFAPVKACYDHQTN